MEGRGRKVRSSNLCCKTQHEPTQELFLRREAKERSTIERKQARENKRRILERPGELPKLTAESSTGELSRGWQELPNPSGWEEGWVYNHRKGKRLQHFGKDMSPLVGSHFLVPGFPRRKADPGYPTLSDFPLKILIGSTIKTTF